jgi:hypothetical protein
MPSGIVHYHYYKYGYIVILPLSAWIAIFYYPIIGLSMLAGFSLGRYVTPDWDLVGTSEDEGRMIREVPVLGILLYGFSSIYGAFFRRHHRSWMTHFPIISTLGRMLLLFWWIPLVYYFFKMQNTTIITDFPFGILIGLSTADAIHWFLDTLTEQESFRNYFREKEEQLKSQEKK